MRNSAYGYCPPGYGPWSFYRGSLISTSGIAANIQEDRDSYIIQLFAPALVKEHFSVTTRNDILYVRYKATGDAFKATFIRKEYDPTAFERSFRLNKKVQVEKIQVFYSEGVLKITLPKKEERKTPS